VLLYDPVFPEIEATFGETLADILLGAVGALFAAIAYETVEMFADRTGTSRLLKFVACSGLS
jgi:hypothetical protein